MVDQFWGERVWVEIGRALIYQFGVKEVIKELSRVMVD